MGLHFNHNYHHKFLLNKEMNLFFLSIFLYGIANSLIGLFVPIYLYENNFSIYKIIIFFLLVSISFVLFSILGAKIVAKIGVKHSMLLSTPFLGIYYLGLNFYINEMFYILPFFLSASMIFYNYGYHLNYIKHSNKKKIGKELSFIGIISVLSSILSPFLGGLIISVFSFNILFLVGVSLLIISILPLFLTKESYEKYNIDFKKIKKYLFKKNNKINSLSFSGYAIESIIGRILWPIFLIIVIKNITKVGFIVSISLLFSILVFYFIGKLTDKYNKSKLLKFGTGLYFISWIGRIFVTSSVGVFFVDSYKNISEKILHIPWSAKSVEISLEENYFLFVVSREIIFNLSRIIILPIIIILFYINYHPFIISFIIAALFCLFYPLLKK